MIERERTDVSDGCSWYCPQCYTRKSIREKSFFAKSRLPLQKWLLLICGIHQSDSVTIAN